ncbi:MAG: fimbrillin family protein [Alistipes sp.]|nr:fimbrillin family protein [Alistipes sp.]
MAKYTPIVLLLASLLPIACSENAESGQPASRGEATVAIFCDNGPEADEYAAAGTRTSIDENDWTSARWSKNDEIFAWATADGGASYALRAQRFTLAYFGVSFSSAVFTATVSEMPAGSYTYTAVSPAPEEISGTQVSYRLPEVQTGRPDSGCDILAADPLFSAEALPSFDNFQQMTGTQPAHALRFRHKCHALRIEIPSGRHHWNGAQITRLQIDFPVDVVGRVSFDATHPSESMTLSEGRSSITLQLDSPLTDQEHDYVWAFINPTAVSGDISFTAYSAEGYRSHTLSVPIDKTLEAGHITPVTLTVPEELPVSYLDLSIADYSRLGEEPTAFEVLAPEGMTFRDGTTSKSFTKNQDNRYTVEFYAGLYGELLRSEPLTVLYESASATRVPGESTVAFAGAERTEVSLVAPYLFSEDFSRTVYNDTHADDNGSTGFEMTDANLPGWTGSRWKVDQQSLEFRTYVPASTTVGVQTGRVDTPPLPIRENKAVKVRVEYRIGATTGASPRPVCTFGLSNQSEAIAGGNGSINYPNTRIEEFQLDKNGSPTNMPTSKTHTIEIPGNTTTRLTWVGYKATGIATRANFYFYLDDIRVTIVP